jgi:hypothetical protein
MNKPLCIIQSPIWTRSGYGDLSLAIAKSMLRYDKFDLLLAPTPWGACSKKNLDSEINDPEGIKLLEKVIRGPVNKQPDLFIQITIPNEFTAAGKYNIGITAGIETTVPKAEWIEGLNRMNLNVITSHHSRDVFSHAQYSKKTPDGKVSPLTVTNPMEVLFWGADTKTYKKTNESVETVNNALAHINETFGFLFVGQWTSGNMASDRKAIGYLIKVFLETFKNVKNPPCLILKTNGAQISAIDRNECLSKISELTNMVKSQNPDAIFPNVYLLHGELSDVEMNALYNHDKVKVHTTFTHGEGFGHPLLLATLSGKPLLSPHWSGHLDFLNPTYSEFFEGQLVPIPQEAINDWFIKEARWFDVDYIAAGKKMKNIFNNYNDKLLKNAELLRAENEQKFSMETMDKTFHAMLDKYLPTFAVQSSIILPKLKKINLPPLKKPVENSSNAGTVTTSPIPS